MTLGDKVEAIIESFNSKYEAGAPGYSGASATAQALRVRYEAGTEEPWIVTIEDDGNPHDYGETHSFQATTFEEAVEALYQDLVVNE